MSTTTTWMDVVRKVCKEKPVDIVFALDSSDGITPSDFWNQVRFVRDFTLGLDIGVNRTRIGVVVFSDQVIHVFDVDDHSSLLSAIRDLYEIKRTYGGTRLDEVIRYVRTRSFRRSVSRREAAQVAVLVTGSQTTRLHKVKKQARMASKSGITIIAVGVGDNVNPEELQIITGSRSQVRNSAVNNFAPLLATGTNRRRNIFTVESFFELENIVMEATIESCTAEVASVPVADQACGTRQEADMMFVMDSASAGRKNTQKSLDFVKKVAGSVEVDNKAIQIGMEMPDECIPQGQSFKLNTHRKPKTLMQELEHHITDDFAKLIRDIRKKSFKKKGGARRNAKKIAILLVDGELDEPLQALTEAQHAKIRGIEVYVIVVGDKPPQPEVAQMCNYPPQNHFFQVDSYNKLKDLESSLVDLLCDEL